MMTTPIRERDYWQFFLTITLKWRPFATLSLCIVPLYLSYADPQEMVIPQILAEYQSTINASVDGDCQTTLRQFQIFFTNHYTTAKEIGNGTQWIEQIGDLLLSHLLKDYLRCITQNSHSIPLRLRLVQAMLNRINSPNPLKIKVLTPERQLQYSTPNHEWSPTGFYSRSLELLFIDISQLTPETPPLSFSTTILHELYHAIDTYTACISQHMSHLTVPEDNQSLFSQNTQTMEKLKEVFVIPWYIYPLPSIDALIQDHIARYCKNKKWRNYPMDIASQFAPHFESAHSFCTAVYTSFYFHYFKPLSEIIREFRAKKAVQSFHDTPTDDIAILDEVLNHFFVTQYPLTAPLNRLFSDEIKERLTTILYIWSMGYTVSTPYTDITQHIYPEKIGCSSE